MEKKVLRFEKIGFEDKKSQLERQRPFYQAVFDRINPLVKEFDFERDFFRLIIDPDKFIRDYLMKEFDLKMEQYKDFPLLNKESVRDQIKLPDNWPDVLRHIQFLFRSKTARNIQDDLKVLFIEKGRVTIDLKKLEADFVEYVETDAEAERLKFVELLCQVLKDMRNSKLWPNHIWEGPISKFTTMGLQPNTELIKLKRDITELQQVLENEKNRVYENANNPSKYKETIPTEKKEEEDVTIAGKEPKPKKRRAKRVKNIV